MTALARCGGPRILVADDHQLTRELLGEVLEEEGYRVALSADGAAAINDCERYRPDLLVADLGMPFFSGLQVMAAARKANPSVRAVILTANPSEVAEPLAKRFGAESFVNKPIDLEDFVALVRRCLGPEGRRRVAFNSRAAGRP